MSRRDSGQEHRAATPLELFFDLCFVVAVAAVSDRLHHALVEDEVGHGLIGYLLVFFGIWWAWMNFTWFASAYDTDDIAYRLTSFVQIAGVLVLAAGVPRAFDSKDFAVVFAGYVVMRVGLITQWLRAARGDRHGRKTALRFATGVAACQAGWAVLLVVPQGWLLPVFLVTAAAELSVPVWAERAGRTPWHPHHIAERYGLFTLIVLGETVLSATTAVQRGFAGEGPSGRLLVIALSGLVVVFGMWWVYFGQQAERFLRSNREGFRWGYGHYLIFSSAAAVGAGLATAVDHESHVGHTPTAVASAAVAVPVAVFLISVWLLHVRPQGFSGLPQFAWPAAAVLVLAAIAASSVPVTLVLIAGLVAALVAVSILAI
jgi:low temperature requirement protein LtrA